MHPKTMGDTWEGTYRILLRLPECPNKFPAPCPDDELGYSILLPPSLLLIGLAAPVGVPLGGGGLQGIPFAYPSWNTGEAPL